MNNPPPPSAHIDMAKALPISLNVVHIAQPLLIRGDLDPGGPSSIPRQAGSIVRTKQPGLAMDGAVDKHRWIALPRNRWAKAEGLCLLYLGQGGVKRWPPSLDR